MTIFDLAQELLDTTQDKENVEKIIGLKLVDAPGRKEMLLHFHNYEAKAGKGPFTRIKLQVPKARGGVSFMIDLREKPTREEILKRFGKLKYPEYTAGGKQMLGQNYKGQTLSWVLNDQGSAERLLIQNGR